MTQVAQVAGEGLLSFHGPLQDTDLDLRSAENAEAWVKAYRASLYASSCDACGLPPNLARLFLLATVLPVSLN